MPTPRQAATYEETVMLLHSLVGTPVCVDIYTIAPDTRLPANLIASVTGTLAGADSEPDDTSPASENLLVRLDAPQDNRSWLVISQPRWRSTVKHNQLIEIQHQDYHATIGPL
jgi:hypothetical protein